jgi:hypothetical protein
LGELPFPHFSSLSARPAPQAQKKNEKYTRAEIQRRRESAASVVEPVETTEPHVLFIPSYDAKPNKKQQFPYAPRLMPHAYFNSSKNGGILVKQSQSGIPLFRRQSLKDRMLAKAVQLTEEGVDGNKQAVQEACTLLEKLRYYYPHDPLISAYYGGALTLRGRDAIDPIERLDYVRQGLKCLDNAVADDPDNVKIRILRGFIGYRLPEFFFHRTATSVADFSYLISRYNQDPDLFSARLMRQLKKDLALAQQTLAKVEKHQVTAKSHASSDLSQPAKEESPDEFPL